MGSHSTATVLVAGLFALVAAAAISAGLSWWTGRREQIENGAGPLGALRALAFPGSPPGGGRGLWPGSRPASGAPLPLRAAQTAFLFEDGRLVDATPAARRLLKGLDRRRGDLAALAGLLARSFGPDLPRSLAALPDGERLSLPGPGGEGGLEALAEDGALRLILHAEGVEEAMMRHALDAATVELERLRALAENAPGPIWALDATGAPVWANRAYLALSDLAQPAAPGEDARGPGTWPARPLFDPPAGLAEGQAETRRLQLAVPGRESPDWFEVTSIRRGEGSMHFAADVGRLVGAESLRSTFVQTLTKTFAHLSMGLAIFDKQRRLVLFNPAFADLTGLSFAFLSGRPPVHTVLDRLREAQVLPEPRNYKSWRDEMAALEAAASSGGYAETWTLPDGRTYRVAGKPQPDGALAFFVEDITDEIALARRVRAEFDAARAVLDSMPEAVAVFSAAGTLSLSNAAYDGLWGPEAGGDESGDRSPEALVDLTDPSLWGELARWEGALGPCALWDDIRAGRAQLGGGTTDIGTQLRVRASPLPGGGLAVGFSRREAAGEEAGPPAAPAGAWGPAARLKASG